MITDTLHWSLLFNFTRRDSISKLKTSLMWCPQVLDDPKITSRKISRFIMNRHKSRYSIPIPVSTNWNNFNDHFFTSYLTLFWKYSVHPTSSLRYFAKYARKKWSLKSDSISLIIVTRFESVKALSCSGMLSIVIIPSYFFYSRLILLRDNKWLVSMRASCFHEKNNILTVALVKSSQSKIYKKNNASHHIQTFFFAERHSHKKLNMYPLSRYVCPHRSLFYPKSEENEGN